MSKRYTSAAELVGLTGLSRERVNQLLNDGRITGAYKEPHGQGTRWRVPVKAAEAWLASRGIAVTGWGLSHDSAGAILRAEAVLREAKAGAIWVAAT